MPEPTDERARWDWLIKGLRAGDEAASREFYRQYGTLMQALAAKHLAPRLKQRVGAEDVAQSACRTFLRRAKGGEFALGGGDDLLHLICAITLSKVREQARFHGRQRRGLSREVPLCTPDKSIGSFGPSDGALSPVDLAAFDDQLRHLMSRLNDEERQLLQLKLDDHTNEEAAEKLGCSERTVRRLLGQIRERLGKCFDEA